MGINDNSASLMRQTLNTREGEGAAIWYRSVYVVQTAPQLRSNKASWPEKVIPMKFMIPLHYATLESGRNPRLGRGAGEKAIRDYLPTLAATEENEKSGLVFLFGSLYILESWVPPQ